MPLFKEKITKKDAVEGVTKVIIDGSKTTFQRMIKFLKEQKFVSDSIPENFTQEEIKNFIIFISFLELNCLPNLFDRETAEELRKLSIECLSRELNIDKERLQEEISIYENRFYEDLKAGVNPFDSLGILKIAAEKIGLKKTEDLGGEESLHPFLALVLREFSFVGIWKKIKESYKIE